MKCVVPDIPVFATRQNSSTKRKSSEFEYRVTVFAGDESNDFQIFVSENERMSWLPRMGDEVRCQNSCVKAVQRRGKSGKN